MRGSRIVWRLWDEILNACGKREFVEYRKKATSQPSNIPGWFWTPKTESSLPIQIPEMNRKMPLFDLVGIETGRTAP